MYTLTLSFFSTPPLKHAFPLDPLSIFSSHREEAGRERGNGGDRQRPRVHTWEKVCYLSFWIWLILLNIEWSLHLFSHTFPDFISLHSWSVKDYLGCWLMQDDPALCGSGLRLRESDPVHSVLLSSLPQVPIFLNDGLWPGSVSRINPFPLPSWFWFKCFYPSNRRKPEHRGSVVSTETRYCDSSTIAFWSGFDLTIVGCLCFHFNLGFLLVLWRK